MARCFCSRSAALGVRLRVISPCCFVLLTGRRTYGLGTLDRFGRDVHFVTVHVAFRAFDFSSALLPIESFAGELISPRNPAGRLGCRCSQCAHG